MAALTPTAPTAFAAGCCGVQTAREGTGGRRAVRPPPVPTRPGEGTGGRRGGLPPHLQRGIPHGPDMTQIRNRRNRPPGVDGPGADNEDSFGTLLDSQGGIAGQPEPTGEDLIDILLGREGERLGNDIMDAFLDESARPENKDKTMEQILDAAIANSMGDDAEAVSNAVFGELEDEDFAKNRDDPSFGQEPSTFRPDVTPEATPTVAPDTTTAATPETTPDASPAAAPEAPAAVAPEATPEPAVAAPAVATATAETEQAGPWDEVGLSKEQWDAYWRRQQDIEEENSEDDWDYQRGVGGYGWGDREPTVDITYGNVADADKSPFVRAADRAVTVAGLVGAKNNKEGDGPGVYILKEPDSNREIAIVKTGDYTVTSLYENGKRTNVRVDFNEDGAMWARSKEKVVFGTRSYARPEIIDVAKEIIADKNALLSFSGEGREYVLGRVKEKSNELMERYPYLRSQN